MTALREYFHDVTDDDALTQEIAAAYYDDEITDEQLKRSSEQERCPTSAY